MYNFNLAAQQQWQITQIGLACYSQDIGYYTYIPDTSYERKMSNANLKQNLTNIKHIKFKSLGTYSYGS